METDVDLAEKIFVPDTVTIKGKSTRRIPHALVDDVIAVPKVLIRMNHAIHLYMDIMYIKK